MAKVVLVDDHPDFCEVLAQLLAINGHSVEVCTCSESAIDSIERELPDAVIADDHLPGMSGLDLLRRIRQDPRLMDVPVIICSASPESRDESRDAGASDFWLKGSDTVFDAIEQFGDRLKHIPSRI